MDNKMDTPFVVDPMISHYQQQLEENEGSRPFLVITKFAEAFCEQTIRQICNGIPIYNINRFKKEWFLNLYNLTDLEECVRRFENANICKFHIGRNVKRPLPMPPTEFKTEAEIEEKIDYNHREFVVSEAMPQRPKFPADYWACEVDFNNNKSLLRAFDPHRRFLKVLHQFRLESFNLLVLPSKNVGANVEYVFRNGRSMPRFKQQLEKPNVAELSTTAKRLINEFDLGTCIVCGGLSETNCSDCMSSLCSVVCLTQACPNHSAVCPKFRRESGIVQATPKMYSSAALPPPKSVVVITAFQSSNIVYIRSKSCAQNMDYLKVLRKVAHAGPSLERLSYTPAAGEVVILKLNDEWLRVVVINSANSEQIRLVCLDYGNLEVAPLINLYKGTETLINLPRFALPVLLKGLPDVFIPVAARTLLYLYTNRLRLKLLYKDDDFDASTGLYSVELYCAVKGINLNGGLANFSIPCQVLNASDDEITIDDLIETQLPVGKNVELVIMDNTLLKFGYISCTTKTCAQEIQKFQRYVQDYAESCRNDHYLPRIDSLCIAKYDVDGKWYRGCCLEKVGDGYPSIRFIDYGNIVPTSTKDLLYYPKEFTFPQLTLECEIKDFPETCDEQILTQILELLPIGSTINCSAHYIDDSYVLDLCNILGEKLNKLLLQN